MAKTPTSVRIALVLGYITATLIAIQLLLLLAVATEYGWDSLVGASIVAHAVALAALIWGLRKARRSPYGFCLTLAVIHTGLVIFGWILSRGQITAFVLVETGFAVLLWFAVAAAARHRAVMKRISPDRTTY